MSGGAKGHTACQVNDHHRSISPSLPSRLMEYYAHKTQERPNQYRPKRVVQRRNRSRCRGGSRRTRRGSVGRHLRFRRQVTSERARGPRKQVESVEPPRAPVIYIAALAASESIVPRARRSRTSTLTPNTGNASPTAAPLGSAKCCKHFFYEFYPDRCGPGWVGIGRAARWGL